MLLGRKEHLISNKESESTSQNGGSFGGLLTKESIQNFLRQEDVGGEGHDGKSINLERKVENTLLFIQPGLNLTASIRIIPVDTEMIHLWRRTRDNRCAAVPLPNPFIRTLKNLFFLSFSSSLMSSDFDLRLQLSQDSVENVTQKNNYDFYGIIIIIIIMVMT